MHLTVEQANERAVNLSIREGLLLWHRRVLRIVVVGETIRGSPSQDNGFDEVWQNPNQDRQALILFTQIQAAPDSFVTLSKMRG